LSKILFDKILIIGLGVIGGSFALAVRKNNIAKEIWAFDVSQETIDFALNNKIIDQFLLLNKEIKNLAVFNLIVIACPLCGYDFVFNKILGGISNDTIISDLGSVKEFIFDLLNKKEFSFFKNNFIATHPIAGLEKTTLQNARLDLFENKKIIICPARNSIKSILKAKQTSQIEAMWQMIKARVLYLSAKQHDKIYALISHLPQKLAFIFKENFPLKDKFNHSLLNKAYRLDDSSSILWQDMFNLNKKNINNFLDKIAKNLEFFEEKINKNLLIMALKYQLQDYKASLSINFLDIKNHHENLLLRIILVASFLKITNLKRYKDYAGSGFEDFILPALIFNSISIELLSSFINQNKLSILDKIQQLRKAIICHKI
jgi:prephenate dehydrogenase